MTPSLVRPSGATVRQAEQRSCLLLAARSAVTSYPSRPDGQQGNLGDGVEARCPGFHGRVRRRSLAPVQTRARTRVCGSARAHAGTGDQPADVRPEVTELMRITGWTRTRLYRHRRQYAGAGRAIGVSGGHWPARRLGERSL